MEKVGACQTKSGVIRFDLCGDDAGIFATHIHIYIHM